MVSDPTCPLCLSKTGKLIETIPVSRIVKAYRQYFKLPIQSYFSSDNEEYWQCQNCQLYYFTPPASGPEDFYTALQDYSWYYQDHKQEYALAAKWIPPRTTVLEIGCGEAAFSEYIDAKHYTGIETNSIAAKHAIKKGYDVRYGTIESLADSLHPFDVVCSFQVLEHVTRPSTFLETALRCLKPGGLLLIAVPSQDSFIAYAANNLLNLPPHHLTRWSDITLKYIAQKFHLTVETIQHEPLDSNHRDWFLATLLRSSLLNIIRRPYSILDRRMTTIIINRIAVFLVRKIPAVLKENLITYGHSVLAVYRR